MRRLQHFLWIAFSFLYMGGLYRVSQHRFERTTREIRTINNLLHIPVYTVLFVLLFACLRPFVKRDGLNMAISGTAAVGFGIFVELQQSGIPGRQSSFQDVMLNVIGVLAGVFIVFYWKRIREDKA